MKTRNGKIARLPKAVREELNRRMDNGEPGPRLTEWLNALPEVEAVLDAEFAGQPVNEQNLSAWRQGGFQDWVRHQEAREWARTLAEQAEELEDEAGETSLSDHLSAPMALALGRLLREAASADGDPAERRSALLAVARQLALLRRCDHEAARRRVEQERWRAEQDAAVAEKRAAGAMAPLYGLLLSEAFGGFLEQRVKEKGGVPPEWYSILAGVPLEANEAIEMPTEPFQKPNGRPVQGKSSPIKR